MFKFYNEYGEVIIYLMSNYLTPLEKNSLVNLQDLSELYVNLYSLSNIFLGTYWIGAKEQDSWFVALPVIKIKIHTIKKIEMCS